MSTNNGPKGRSEPKAKHTPGPWQMHDCFGIVVEGYGDCDPDFMVIADVFGANAARIVECVNAMEPDGIVAKALEEAADWLACEITPSGDIPEGLPQLQRLVREACKLIGGIK